MKLLIALLLVSTNALSLDINTDSKQAQQALSSTYNNIDTSERIVNHGGDIAKGMGYTPSPNGTIGLNVCSKHGGASAGWGGFNFGLLVPFSDEDCNRRQNAVTLGHLGSVNTGKEVLCENVAILRASVRAGQPCWLGDPSLLDKLSDKERDYYHALVNNKVKDDAYIKQQLDKKVDRMFEKAMIK